MIEDAEKGFSRSLEINPSNLPALRNRAYSRIKLGKQADALEDLRRCIEPGTTDADVYNKAGALCAIAGNSAEAISLWQKSFAINPDQKRII